MESLTILNTIISGGWSESGETFVVKDAKSFAEKVIPMVYKHNNFSSFVRQLNFCKFFGDSYSSSNLTSVHTNEVSQRSCVTS